MGKERWESRLGDYDKIGTISRRQKEPGNRRLEVFLRVSWRGERRSLGKIQRCWGTLGKVKWEVRPVWEG